MSESLLASSDEKSTCTLSICASSIAQSEANCSCLRANGRASARMSSMKVPYMAADAIGTLRAATTEEYRSFPSVSWFHFVLAWK